jgi:GntR family transcriptional repressor for pyruvate dehydrogenase complex
LKFQSVKTTKTYPEIVDQITRLIQEGYLSIGDKLPAERELAPKLGVSRACLREALSALETIGVVACKPGKGTYVRNDAQINLIKKNVNFQEKDSPLVIIEARRMLEPLIVRLAVQRADLADLDFLNRSQIEIAQIIAQASSYIDNWNQFHLDFAHAAHNFHLGLAKAAHNVLFEEMLNLIFGCMHKELWLNQRRKNFLTSEKIIELFQDHYDDHQDILQAIEQKDQNKAIKALGTHLQKISNSVNYNIYF